jgi:uncharacterized protein
VISKITRRPVDVRARNGSLKANRPHLPKTTDLTGLYTNEQIGNLDSLLGAYEKQTGIEIAVLTIKNDLDDSLALDDYTLQIFKNWGIGKADKDNGILIGIAPSLRRLRIQLGYGIEKILSDAETKQIIDSVIIPEFKQGNFFKGTKDGILGIEDKLKKNGL